MLHLCVYFLIVLLGSPFIINVVLAQERTLLPKYGSLPKNEAQKAADEKFLLNIDTAYKGDRKKAAEDCICQRLAIPEARQRS